jgi:hypothetical protein
MASTTVRPTHKTPRTLYVRTERGAAGPYSRKAVRKMIRSGVLTKSGAVSHDGVSWRRADTIKGLFPRRRSAPVPPKTAAFDQTRSAGQVKTAEPFRASKEARSLLTRLENRPLLTRLLRSSVMGPALLGILAAESMALAAAMGLTTSFSWQTLWVTAALGIVVLLVSVAALTSAGSRLAHWMVGLSDLERRFLALHVAPKQIAALGWSRLFQKWLYRGDHLLCNEPLSPPAYMHVFHAGASVDSAQDDVALWKRLAGSLPYALRPLCHPGHTLRQIQAVEALPRWSTSLELLTDGYVLGGVLDHNYARWAAGFLGRARERLGLERNRGVQFCLASVELNRDEQVLVACVWPRKETPHEGATEEGTVEAA